MTGLPSSHDMCTDTVIKAVMIATGRLQSSRLKASSHDTMAAAGHAFHLTVYSTQLHEMPMKTGQYTVLHRSCLAHKRGRRLADRACLIHQDVPSDVLKTPLPTLPSLDNLFFESALLNPLPYHYILGHC